METELLLQEYLEHTRKILNQVEYLKLEDTKILTWRPSPSAWNILECLEHLNLYGEYYLPLMERGIKHSVTKPTKTVKSSFLGRYFSKSMLPKVKLNKMKTFKDKNPIHKHLNKEVIDKFIHQQTQLLELLNASRNSDLNKIKIPISIAKFIRLSLADTFQFVINHNLRHMEQIKRNQLLFKD